MVKNSEKSQAIRIAERRARVAKILSKFLSREIAFNNQRLLDFFTDFKNMAKLLIDEKIAEHTKQAEDCAKIIGKNLKNVDKIKERLEKSGISLSFPIDIPLGMGSYRDDNEDDEDKDAFTIYHEFNGSRISKELLTPEGLQRLKEDYEAAKASNARYEEEKMYLNREMEEYEKKLKHTIFQKKKDEIKDALEEDNERLVTISSNIRNTDAMKHTIEVVESLTPEQKEDILKYIESTENLMEATKVIEEHKRRIAEIKEQKGGPEIITQAFENTIQKRGLSIDTVTELFSVVRRLEEKVQTGLFENKGVKKDVLADDYLNISEAFLTYIFEPEKPVAEQEFLIRLKEKQNRKSKKEDSQQGDEENAR